MKEQESEARWFFAESAQTGKWSLFDTDEEKLDEHIGHDFKPKVGKALPETLTDLLEPSGKWIIRLIPSSASEQMLEFFAAVRGFAESQGGTFEYPWGEIVELINEVLTIDRANRTNRTN